MAGKAGLLIGVGTAAASEGAGAALGSAVLPVVGTVIGAGIGALMSWYGMNKQAEATEKANVINLGLEKEKMGEQKKEFQQTMAMTKEQQKYNRIQKALDGLTQTMNSQPQFANNLINIWRNRRAA